MGWVDGQSDDLMLQKSCLLLPTVAEGADQARWAWPSEGVRKEKVVLAAGGRLGGSVSAPGAWEPVFPQDQMERPRVSDSDILPVVLLEGHVQEIGRRVIRAAGNMDGREGAANRTRSAGREEPLQWESCGQVEGGARNQARQIPPRTKDFFPVPCALRGPCPLPAPHEH